MSAEQLPLIAESGVTRCGYCLRGLVGRGDGSFWCARCGPQLGFVSDIGDYRQFVSRAWKDRVQ